MSSTETKPTACAAIVATVAAAIAASPAAADPRAEARVLADRGEALFAEERFTEACTAFEASVAKASVIAVRARLAACYEAIDRLATAWAVYRDVAEAAARAGDRRRARAARKRAADLAPRLGRITIRLGPDVAADGLAVTRDGQPIPPAELGVAIPLDAGAHAITAAAAGAAPFARDVDLADGAAIEVVIPALAPTPVATPTPTSTPAAPPAPANGAPADPPTIEPGSARAKAAAQQLVDEGIALVERKDLQAALDRFVAAYGLYPSPKLLLNMAATLREMGRLSDAADMYQAFIEAPDTNAAFVGEAKAILNQLDDQLYVLMVRVTPRGADVQLDGGPWVSVGEKRMMVRLRPGLHLVRARKPGYAIDERTVNAFEGEKTDLELVLATAPPEPAEGGAGGEEIAVRSPEPAAAVAAGGASKDGKTVIPLLATGARAERGGALYHSTAVIPDDEPVVTAVAAPSAVPENELGISAQLRIDGAGGGAALAAGVSFAAGSAPRLELDLTGMVSKPTPPSGIAMDAVRIYGVFLGARYRALTGQIRPTVGVGVPVFYSDGRARIGARAAAGAELVINGHLAVVGELGLEHFFNAQDGYRTNVFVPLVQITGRL